MKAKFIYNAKFTKISVEVLFPLDVDVTVVRETYEDIKNKIDAIKKDSIERLKKEILDIDVEKGIVTSVSFLIDLDEEGSIEIEYPMSCAPPK